MNTTIRKPKHDLDIKGEPIKAPKWKNLHFDKYGRSLLGGLVYSSQEAARLAWEQQLAENRARWPKQEKRWASSGGKMLKKDYSHTIQMPVQS